MSPTGTTASYCRICAAACGIVVTVDDAARSSRCVATPTTRRHAGYTCSKGRGLAGLAPPPDRLDQPRLHGAEAPLGRRCSTTSAPALARARRPTVPMRSGSTSRPGSPTTPPAGGRARRGWPSLGSRRSTRRSPSTTPRCWWRRELVAGHPCSTRSGTRSPPALLVLVGTNPVVSHGYGTTLPDPVAPSPRVPRARRAGVGGRPPPHRDGRPRRRPPRGAAGRRRRAAGRRGPRRCSPRWSTRRRRLRRPRTSSRLRQVLAPFTVERGGGAAGRRRARVHRLVADVRVRPGRVAMMCGTGTTMALDGVLVEWLRWVVLVLSGSLDRPGGMRFHDGPFGRLRPARPTAAAGPPGPPSRPDLPRVVQQHPAVAMVDEIEARQRCGLWSSPAATRSPRSPSRTGCAPHWTASTCSRWSTWSTSELCGLATHVLPATGQLERADLTLTSPLSVRSAVQATRRSSPPGRSAVRPGGSSPSSPGGWRSTCSDGADPSDARRRGPPPSPPAGVPPRRCGRRLRGRAPRGRRCRSSTAG